MTTPFGFQKENVVGKRCVRLGESALSRVVHTGGPQSQSPLSMDSLLANYASSDEDGGETLEASCSPSKLSESFAKDNDDHLKSTTLLGTLPPPKSSSSSPSSSILFSSLPFPKTMESSPSGPAPKRVVQFKPPINTDFLKSQSDEDDDEPAPKVKSTVSSLKTSSLLNLSALLPPPKNTLGPSSSSRRSLVQTVPSEVPTSPTPKDVEDSGQVAFPEQEVGYPDWGYGVAGGSDVQHQENCGDYENQQQFWDGSGGYTNWVDESWTLSGGDQSELLAENAGRMDRKRGRNEIPENVIEVKQDQLIGNRPRQDQVRLTGIAFGTGPQPVSSGSKPSKLHRRKHQIQSLYHDMKQKETELSERRARGLLTKAQTQAKYGW